jgi:hypothetical protein
MGYTREAAIHTMCTIDEFRRDGDTLRLGGVAFAGSRGIRQVQVRVANGNWVEATLESAYSKYSWTRYKAELPAPPAGTLVQARAMDGEGKWQAETEIPMFPGGVAGPTVRKLSL